MLKFVKWDNKGIDSVWRLDGVIDILRKVQNYADKKGLKDVCVLSVEDNSYFDQSNDRYDIEISYGLCTQKLLMLKGEIIDGEEFHKRFHEFYP